MPDSKTKHNQLQKSDFSSFTFPVESCHIVLLSNILDFVPCDLLGPVVQSPISTNPGLTPQIFLGVNLGLVLIGL